MGRELKVVNHTPIVLIQRIESSPNHRDEPFRRRSPRIRQMLLQKSNSCSSGQVSKNTAKCSKQVHKKRVRLPRVAVDPPEVNLELNTHSKCEAERKPVTKRTKSLQENLPIMTCNAALQKSDFVTLYKKVPDSVQGNFIENGRKYVIIKWKDQSTDLFPHENLTSEMKRLLHDFNAQWRENSCNVHETATTCELPKQTRRTQPLCQGNSSALHKEPSTPAELPSSSNIDDDTFKTTVCSIDFFKQKQKECLKDSSLLCNLGIENANIDVKIEI